MWYFYSLKRGRDGNTIFYTYSHIQFIEKKKFKGWGGLSSRFPFSQFTYYVND